jgi:hypothetical protein
VREFISPVLLASAKIAGNVKLAAELNILGKKAYGHLDYAILYKMFFLLITEAKNDDINHGVMQNIGQLLAARDEYLQSLAGPKKRNYMSTAGDITNIPSTGVASTGDKWALIRYVLLPQPAVFKSPPMTLPSLDDSPEVMKRHLLKRSTFRREP